MNNPVPHRRRHAYRALLFRAVVTFLPLLAPGSAQAANADHTLWVAKWSHDGSRFAIGGVHVLWVFDPATLERKSLLPVSKESDSGDPNAPYMAVTSVAWHPDDSLLAVSSQGPGGDVTGIYDLKSSRRIALAGAFARGVSWSPEGDALAITSDGNLKIWRPDGTLLRDIPRYREGKGLTGVAWRPTGDRIVTIGARITLHDAQGQPLRQMMHRPEARERLQLLLSVAWHPSGEFFAVGDYGTEEDDPVLQFWSAEGQLLKSISLKNDTQIRNLSWNRDGSRLASASRKLKIWTRDGTLESEAESPDLLWGVDWHPDGDRVLTSSIQGRVTLWSAAAGVMKEIVLPPASSR